MKRTLLSATALAAVALLVLAPGALAATSDVGKNIGSEIKSWDTALLLAVAGLLAIPVLAKRDVSGGITLALLVVLVGGFAFAPTEVESVITSLWHTIAG